MSGHAKQAWFLLLLTILCIPQARATDIQARNVAVSVSLETAAKPEATIWVAIRQTIRPGWHTYWQNPGMAGLPLKIEWSLPEGITAGSIRWPVPERFSTGGIVDYGYRDQATFLVPLIVGDVPVRGRKIADMKLSWLVCAEMCIPEDARVELNLGRAGGASRLFAKARAALPRAISGAVRATYDDHTLKLSIDDPEITKSGFGAAQFFPGAGGIIDDASIPEIRIDGSELVLTEARPVRPQPISRVTGILALSDGQAFEIAADAKPAFRPVTSAVQPETGVSEFFVAMIFAFIGGLILNVMPCVLPVLSMKALTLFRANGNAAALRREALFYFAGVIMAFGSLAVAILLFKQGGAAIGWGFQLQSPMVVFWLALLMMAIGCNLFGLFELGIPGFASNIACDGDRGTFLTGLLAVFVATPCTAPFMGVALAYAIVHSGLVLFAVMMALGVGFTLPVLLLAVVPGLARVIPKPGPWTARFRQFLAFPMFGSGIWMIWVLDRQTGPSGLVMALTIALVLVFLFWLLPLISPRVRVIAGLAGFAGLAALSSTIQPVASVDSAGQRWAAWSPQAVVDAQRSGRPVLIDFTAAWCVTCLVNESVALDNPDVSERLARDRFALLRADWTSQDSAITNELARLHRTGVPLYLLYPTGGAGDPLILPQILTPATILTALDHASAKSISISPVSHSNNR